MLKDNLPLLLLVDLTRKDIILLHLEILLMLKVHILKQQMMLRILRDMAQLLQVIMLIVKEGTVLLLEIILMLKATVLPKEFSLILKMEIKEWRYDQLVQQMQLPIPLHLMKNDVLLELLLEIPYLLIL